MIVVIIQATGNPSHIPFEPIILYNAYIDANGIISVDRTERTVDSTDLSMAS